MWDVRVPSDVFSFCSVSLWRFLLSLLMYKGWFSNSIDSFFLGLLRIESYVRYSTQCSTITLNTVARVISSFLFYF